MAMMLFADQLFLSSCDDLGGQWEASHERLDPPSGASVGCGIHAREMDE